MTSKVERFTFCWNGPSDHKSFRYRRRRWGNTRETRQIFENSSGANRYALMFQANEHAFEELAEMPVVHKLLGVHRTIFGHALEIEKEPVLLISSVPNTVDNLRDSQHETLLVWNAGTARTIPLSQLYNVCNRLEKFSTQCEHCPNIENGPWKCVTFNLRRWAHKQDKPMVNIRGAREHSPEPEEFEKLLRQTKQIGAFYYTPPKHTLDRATDIPTDKQFIVRPYRDHFLTHVEKNVEELSERSSKSAESRKSTRVCDARCLFTSTCDWRHNNWRCRATACQKGEDNTYQTWTPENGPYPEEEVRTLYHRWVDTLPHRSVEDISLIVANAGAVTRARGYEMVLAGMDDNLNLVEFIHMQRGMYRRRLFYKFEDALELLRIPWRRENKYVRPEPIRRNPYILTKDELAIYAEIRQHRSIDVGYGGFGSGSREILYVDRRHGRVNGFHIEATNGRNRSVSNFAELVAVFHLNQTMRQFSKWRDEGEEVRRGSS